MTDQPIKVLHVVHWPVSGITSLLGGLIPLITAEGVNCHILFFYHDADTVADFARICRTAHSLDLSRSYARGLRHYAGFIKTIAPDILHTHSFQPLVWGSLLNRRGGRHVTTVHSNYPYFTKRTAKSLVKKSTERFFIRQCGIRTIAVGKVVYALLGELGVPRHNLSLIENGVDVNAYEGVMESRPAARRELGIENDQFVFATLGRLDIGTKGYDILLQAFRGICDRHGRKVLLMFIGDGPDRSRLEEMAQRYGVSPQVKFIGYKKDPVSYLCAGDAYVCSSVIEGFGLATAEAMLCGLPVIATRVGANPEMITHGISGILIEPGDPEAITSAMSDFVSRRYPLEDMAQRGKRQVAGKYDIRNTAAAYVKLYKSMMEPPG